MSNLWAFGKKRGLQLAAAALFCVLISLPQLMAEFKNGEAPENYKEGFERGGLFFDDAVGVVHIRQSGSTAESGYAPGIKASDGHAYARLLVQPSNNINNDQFNGTCVPGAPTGNSSFSCGGPFTDWGLPYGGVDLNFDTGIPITGKGALTSIDIYLDIDFAAAARGTAGTKDYRFDWDSDLLDTQGQSIAEEFVFNVATGQTGDPCAPSTGGFYVIEASFNLQRFANPHNAPPFPPQACISNSGWYRFTHIFIKDQNNNLEVDMFITRAEDDDHPLAIWKLHPTCQDPQDAEGLCTFGAPLPFSAVGAHFLGIFPDQEINDLAVDNLVRRNHPED